MIATKFVAQRLRNYKMFQLSWINDVVKSASVFRSIHTVQY